MKTRTLALLTVGFLTLTAAVSLTPSGGLAYAQDNPAAASATEDVVHMTDGRVLRGKIVNETKSLVIFEYFDSAVKLTAKITLIKDDIALIERNVAVVREEKPAEEPKPTMRTSSTSKNKTEPARTYGTARTKADEVPAFYIVPMSGQMETDIRSEVYSKVIEDIKAHKPGVIVIKLECSDIDDSWASLMGFIDQKEMGLMDLDDSGVLADMFRNELRDIPQVVWVQDSVGISSTLALAWQDLYMTPAARLAGMIMVLAQSGATAWQDSNIRAKMYAAWTKAAIGFLERGGYAHELGRAMIDPEHVLSATWKGREVKWALDASGEYIVDGTDKLPANFSSKMAEDFCISKGTAETLDDLALLLGYREYRVVDGQAEKIVSDYKTEWRRRYDEAKKLLDDIKQWQGWASGQDEVRYLGKIRGAWERILASMEKYKAVEIRLGREFGLSKEAVIFFIEELKERLRQAGNGGRRTGGGGLGGGGGSGTAN